MTGHEVMRPSKTSTEAMPRATAFQVSLDRVGHT